MKTLLLTILLMNLVACTGASDDPSSGIYINFDEPMNEASEKNAQQIAEENRQSRLIDENFNKNARAINRRLKAAYDRGVEACRNLAEAGYSNREGCPRPQPNYVELR